jgi:hypothetical protein
MDRLTNATVLNVFLFFYLVFLVPYIFFLAVQQKTLQVVREENRAMKPWQVWLQLLPLFGLVWQFNVVKAIADSLRAEIDSRNRESSLGIWDEGISDEVNIHPTYTTGRWYCILVCITAIPFLGFFVGILTLILWITYWAQLNKYRHIVQL